MHSDPPDPRPRRLTPGYSIVEVSPRGRRTGPAGALLALALAALAAAALWMLIGLGAWRLFH